MRNPTRTTTAFACLILVMTGCSQGEDNSDQTADMSTVLVDDNALLPEAENATTAERKPEAAKDVTPPGAQPSQSIPSAIRGRWGMAATDCTSLHGDAKGLLEISATTLIFYESRGELTRLKEREPTRIVGSFAFSGEGMTWRRDMQIDVQDDGQTLIRREFGEDAAPAPIRYRRCAG